jgi:hypothetical protein
LAINGRRYSALNVCFWIKADESTLLDFRFMLRIGDWPGKPTSQVGAQPDTEVDTELNSQQAVLPV